MHPQQHKSTSSQLLGNSNYKIIINPSNSNQQGMQQQMKNGGRYLNLIKGNMDQTLVGNVNSTTRPLSIMNPSQMDREYLSINMNPSQSSEMGQYPMQSNTQMTQTTIPSLSSQSSYMVSASQEQDQTRNPIHQPSVSSKIPSMMRDVAIQKNDENHMKQAQNMNVSMSDMQSKLLGQRTMEQMKNSATIQEMEKKINSEKLDLVSLDMI